MSKTMQNSIQTRKQKLHNSMNKSQKAFQNLTLMVIDPILPQFNPIESNQRLYKCEGAGIPLRSENKSCLT